MSEPFTIEWLGGPAEFHFRKARPEGEFDWESLVPARYPPSLVVAAREVWMGIVIAEYSAIAAFAEVVSALTQARAPLDMIGMTSDFLADEVRHVELASHVVMRLGGAPVRHVDTARLAPRTAAGLSALQRASELSLRVGCVAEVFASGTAVPIMRETTHPLLRSVYESILRDEARHRRFGSLYFEWAADKLDAAERARLGSVTLDALSGYAELLRGAQKLPDTRQEWQGVDFHELGWMEPSRFVPLGHSVVREQIIEPLRKLGITWSEPDLEALLGPAKG